MNELIRISPIRLVNQAGEMLGDMPTADALKMAEEASHEMDVHAIHLEVSRNNPAAQRLYRKAGFVSNDRSLLTKRIGPAKSKSAD